MPSISVLLVRPLIAALPATAHEAFFGATDLTRAMLNDADARITPAQFCVAWAEVTRLTNQPHIALAIAAATPAGAFGIVEYVCRSAPTLGVALQQWCRYLSLLDDAVKVALVEERDRACVRVELESEAPAPASHELCFALLARQAHELCASPATVIGVEFKHRVPRDAAAYRQWFGAPVTFGARYDQLIFTHAALAIPLRSFEPNLLAVLTPVAVDQQRQASANTALPLTQQVRRLLIEALRGGDANIEAIASRVGLTPRSLQRRLKDEQTSFNVVREEVRRTLASRYLDDGLAIAEISFLLGFSEPSAFFRAFKRWTGLTPLESRARLQTQTA